VLQLCLLRALLFSGCAAAHQSIPFTFVSKGLGAALDGSICFEAVRLLTTPSRSSWSA
jgi:hypothetical protein